MNLHECNKLLHEAVRHGDVEAARRAVTCGANVNSPLRLPGGTRYATPLMIAAARGDTSMLHWLLQSGASPRPSVRCNFITPLHMAAARGHVNAMRVLLDAGAEPCARTLLGETALHVAARCGRPSVVVLLAHVKTAEGDLRDIRVQGETALHLALRHNHDDAVLALLANGCNMQSRLPNGDTPLHLAVRVASIDIVHVLLWYGPEIDARTPSLDHISNGSGNTEYGALGMQSGYSALHVAARNGNSDACVALLDAGADMNLAATDGSTPLMLAARHGHFTICCQLLQRGADLHRRDREDRTAIALAMHHRYEGVVRLLRGEWSGMHAANQLAAAG